MLRWLVDIFLSPSKLNIRLILGMLGWLVFVVLQWPEPGSRQWGEALLSLATVLVVPIGISWLTSLENAATPTRWAFLHASHLPAAILLMFSFALDTGWEALLLAVPWFAVLLGLSWLGIVRLVLCRPWSICELSFDGGAIFTIVGGAWLLCDRIGYRPLDFDPDIVFLTAIHFHYAGLALPLAAGLLVQFRPRWWNQVTAVGILISVPLVAAGITLSHVANFTFLETLAAGLLSLFGTLVALDQLLLVGRKNIPLIARLGWGFASLALLAAMILSGLYGLRHYVELAELDIPFMRKWHGTLAALGYAAPTLLIWHQFRKHHQSSISRGA